MAAELHDLHRVWTYEDLEGLPDDGYRYEIIDGHLLMTPPPTPEHQDVIANLGRILDDRLDYGYFKIGVGMRAPRLGATRYVIPDACVVTVRRPPLYYEPQQLDLAVEVTSDGSITYDRGLKKEVYRDHGIGTYWLVDLKDQALKSYTLAEGEYKLQWTMTHLVPGQGLLADVWFGELLSEG